jgi:hypothetical protein
VHGRPFIAGKGAMDVGEFFAERRLDHKSAAQGNSAISAFPHVLNSAGPLPAAVRIVGIPAGSQVAVHVIQSFSRTLLFVDFSGLAQSPDRWPRLARLYK